MLGNEVATLVDEYNPAGIYEVEFNTGPFRDASNLTSGVHIYKLTAGSFSASRKMMLLK